MTATLDRKSTLVSQLISSCYNARNGYRSAASTVDDATLKLLFEIYAQQRTRFAEELRDYMPAEQLLDGSESNRMADSGSAVSRDSQSCLRDCVEMDARNLALYREALADRALPARAHLTISAQLWLMQRVHDRLRLILSERLKDRTPLRVAVQQRVSA